MQIHIYRHMMITARLIRPDGAVKREFQREAGSIDKE